MNDAVSPAEMRQRIHAAMPHGGPLRGLVFSQRDDGSWEFTNNAGRSWHPLCAPDVLDVTLRSRLVETMSLPSYDVPSWGPTSSRPQMTEDQELPTGGLLDVLLLAQSAMRLRTLLREHFWKPKWQELDDLLVQIADTGRQAGLGLVPLIAEEARQVINPMRPPAQTIAVALRNEEGNIDKGLGEWERWIVGYAFSHCFSVLARDIRLAVDAGDPVVVALGMIGPIERVLEDGRFWLAYTLGPCELMQDAREFHKTLLYLSKRTENGLVFGPVTRRRLRKSVDRLAATALAERRRQDSGTRAEFSPVDKLGDDQRWQESDGAWLCGPTDNSEPTLWMFPTSRTKEPKARVAMLPPLRLPAAGAWRREDEHSWAKRMAAHTTEVAEVNLLGEIRKCEKCGCPMIPSGADACPNCQSHAEAKALPIAPEVRNAHAIIAFFGTDEAAAHAAMEETKAFLAMAEISGIPPPAH